MDSIDDIYAIRKENARLRAMVEDLQRRTPEAPSGETQSVSGLDIFIFRITRAGIIAYANSAFLRFSGLHRQQVIGQHRDVLRGSSHPHLMDSIFSMTNTDAKPAVINENARSFRVKSTMVSDETHIVIEDITELSRLQSYIARYVMSDIGSLTEKEVDTFRFPERRFMSVSFTDLRGFTAMCEHMPPDDVRLTVNAYLEAVISAVDANKATVDKIVGDEVMALYGAPRHYRDHALRAVKTALEQAANMSELVDEFRRQGREMPLCGIGVNTGDMILGNIGSESRQDYTVLGASVNLAARLCGAALGGQVLLTETTLKDLLENLPAGWASTRIFGASVPDRSTSAGKVEGVFALPDVLAGVGYEIGPPGTPMYRLLYRYAIKVKGVEQPLPVIEATAIDTPDKAADTPDKKSVLSDAVTDTRSERIFGKYRLIEKIGRGGMAEVWRARDAYGNDVAVKMLISGESASPEQIVRFMREAEAMKILDHRNICRVIDVGQYENVSYIAMELIHGVTLGRILETNMDIAPEKPVERIVAIAGNTRPAEGEKPTYRLHEIHALAIFDSMLAGVIYAHEKGIIHRDLKPENIMLRYSGEAVVMDLGLARFEQSESDLTLTREVVGTIDFMAPEQAASSRRADERSDIFSLGAILYFMVTGRKWYVSTGNIVEDAAALREHPVVPPRKINPHVGFDLQLIIMKALDKDPDHRYQSVRELHDDITHYRNDEPIHARPDSGVYRTAKNVYKYRGILTPSVIALIILAAGISFFYGERLKELFTWHLVAEEDFQHWNVTSLSNNWIGYVAISNKAGYRKTVLPFEKMPELFITSNRLWISNSARTAGLYFRNDIPWNMRVEWTCTTAGPGIVFFINGRHPGDGYTFRYHRHGFWQLTKYQDALPIDETAVPIMHDLRTWKLCMERSGDNVRLYVNGKRMIDHVDRFAIGTKDRQTFGFSAETCTLQTISTIRVYTQSLPQKVSALVLADRLLHAGDFPAAYEEYRSIAISFRNSDIGKEALFKMGITQLKQGKTELGDNGLMVYENNVGKHRFIPYAMVERAQIHAANGETNEADALYRTLAARYPGHAVLREAMNQITRSLLRGYEKRAKKKKNDLTEYLLKGRSVTHAWADILQQRTEGNPFLVTSAAWFSSRREYAAVLEYYADQPEMLADAKAALGTE